MPEHEDKGTAYIEVYEQPDREGREAFTVDWWCKSQERWRGQVFRAYLGVHAAQWEKDGFKVQITYTGNAAYGRSN